jgi:hypothetical protein
MIHASQKPDLATIGERAFTEVLAVLLSLPAPARTQRPVVDAAGLFTAMIPLSGPRLSGTVRVLLPPPFVAWAVKHLTGLNGAEGEALHEDTAGEIANMIAGRVAAQLAAAGYPCALDTPSVARSADLPTEIQPGVSLGRTDLLCDEHCLALEIHCRYTAR